MRIFFCLLFIFTSAMASAQLDLETRFIKIKADRLPKIPEINSYSLGGSTLKPFSSKLPSFEVTEDNYWIPVDMVAAMENSNTQKAQVNIAAIRLESSYNKNGITIYQNKNGLRASTTVENSVYQESRGWYDIRPSNQYLGRSSYYSPYTYQKYNPYGY